MWPLTANQQTAHILVLSTAEWDAPVWTNKQFIARELAREHTVTYMSSLGLRRPQFRLTDLRRMVSRASLAASDLRTKRPSSRCVVDKDGALVPGVAVRSPFVVPLHGKALARWMNQFAVRRAVNDWLETPREQRFLWTFSPITYGLERHASGLVYQSVDLLEHFPGVDRATFRNAERQLAVAGTPAIASSPPVQRHLLDIGFRDVTLWENVAEVELFSQRAASSVREPGLVVFAGNLTDYKVDFDLLLATARMSPHIRLVLAGPIADGGGRRPKGLDRLLEAGAEWLGPLAPDALADLFSRSCVGLIPYQLNAYTEGVFPMKLYEYLAAGLAVVSTPLPALRAKVLPDLYQESRAEDFAALTAKVAIPVDADHLARRVASAAQHSWSARGREARAYVNDSLALSSPASSIRVIP